MEEDPTQLRESNQTEEVISEVFQSVKVDLSNLDSMREKTASENHLIAQDVDRANEIERSILGTLSKADSTEKSVSPTPIFSRREFLKATGAAMVAASGINKYPEAIDAVESAYSKEELVRSIEELRRHLSDRYNIEVHMGENPTISDRYSQGDLPYLVRLEKSLAMLTREITVYPPYMFKESGLANLTLVKELQSKKTPLWDRLIFRGMANGLQNKDSGVTLAVGGSSALEVKPASEVRSTFHHELFHAFDDIPDSYWVEESGQNPSDYVYGVERGSAGKALAQQGVIESNPERKGTSFSRDYGTADPGEDRATVYEAMIGNKQALMEAMKNNEVFRKKVMMVYGHLLQKSHGVMNLEYWNAYYAGGLSEQYVDEMIANCATATFKEYTERYAGEIQGLSEQRFLEWQKSLQAAIQKGT